MKIFKSVDEKFEELGYKKTRDDDAMVTYRCDCGTYTHVIDINRAFSEICSYEEDNSVLRPKMIRLSLYTAKLCMKKVKQRGWKIKKK